MKPKTALQEYKQKVDVELEKYFQRKIAEYEKVSPFAVKFTQDLADFTLRGGKRLRAALIYYSYKLFGGKDDEEVIKLSMFIELIESFLLIHDDIMDRALLRRGGVTIHKVYEKYSHASKFKDDKHFGRSMGILSGDLANQFGLEIIAEAHFPALLKNKLVKLVSDEVSKVIFGQIHDILLDYNSTNYTEEDILKVHLYKTAAYTYRLPLVVGAILAGATQTELEIIDEFAKPSGIAFQIRDDVLGVFGKSAETGKETKSDLTEGKKTLLVLKAYEKATPAQKAKLDMYLGKDDLTDEEADEVRIIFKESGALRYSTAKCRNQVALAMQSLKKLEHKDPEAYLLLEDVTNYMIIRDF